MQMMNLRQQGHWLDWWAWTWCESRPRAFSQPHPNPTEHLWEIYLWRLCAAIIKLWTSEYVFRKTPFVPWTSSIGGPELKPNGRLGHRGVVLLRCKIRDPTYLNTTCTTFADQNIITAHSEDLKLDFKKLKQWHFKLDTSFFPAAENRRCWRARHQTLDALKDIFDFSLSFKLSTN